MALFQMSEFVKMAIKDEETGMAFYKGMADSTDIKELKAAFLEIAEQERHHAAIFQDMLATLKELRIREEYKEQYEEYLRVLLESRAFPDPQKAREKALTIKGAEGVDIAMRMEKDTLLFYRSMLSLIPSTHSKYVNDIIEEEQYHLTQLSKLKRL